MISPSLLRYHMEGLSKFITILPGGGSCQFITTRSYAALRAADLDWIVRPGYSWGKYIWRQSMKNQPGKIKKTMKNQPGTIKTMKTNLEP